MHVAITAATVTIAMLFASQGAAAGATSVPSIRASSSSEVADLYSMLQVIDNIPESALRSDEALSEYVLTIQAPALKLGSTQTQDQLLGVQWGFDWGAAVKCSAAIGTALLGVGIPALKLLKIKKLISELGGSWKAAQLLVGAGTAAEKGEAIAIALASLVSELTGISGIVDACPKVLK